MGELIFSIIVPVYNLEKRLRLCIESILAQTNQAFEILLIDDGSTDRSGMICDEYAKKEVKIRAFHKQNGGVSSARNLGIKEARGKKLLFIDGDDTIEKELLENVLKTEEESSQLIVFGMVFDHYKDGKFQYSQIFSYGSDVCVTLEELGKHFEAFFLSNSLSSACNKVFSKELIDRYRIRFSEKMYLYEDFAFVLEYLKYTEKIKLMSHSYYHYQMQVGQEHLKGRVSDLERLLDNLDHLEKKVMELQVYAGEDYAGIEIFERLYLQLLYLHLLYTGNIEESVVMIRKKLEEKNVQDRLQNLSQICGENEKALLLYGYQDSENSMTKWVCKKQRIYKIKQKCRPLLNKIKELTGR